jgi:integrase/recombinase XerD
MDDQTIRWDLYPHVAAEPHACAFIDRLRQFAQRPKTIDAYARNLDAYLACFGDASAERWIDADEGDVLTYLDDLRYGRRATNTRSRRVPPENVVSLSGIRVADATIAQHVVTIRQFYEYLIRTRVREDGVNPLPRGSAGRHGDTAQRGPLSRRTRLPWIAPTDVWRRIVLHVITHETVRNRAMILVAYDGALRREELVRVRVDDYDRDRAPSGSGTQ